MYTLRNWYSQLEHYTYLYLTVLYIFNQNRKTFPKCIIYHTTGACNFAIGVWAIYLHNIFHSRTPFIQNVFEQLSQLFGKWVAMIYTAPV